MWELSQTILQLWLILQIYSILSRGYHDNPTCYSYATPEMLCFCRHVSVIATFLKLCSWILQLSLSARRWSFHADGNRLLNPIPQVWERVVYLRALWLTSHQCQWKISRLMQFSDIPSGHLTTCWSANQSGRRLQSLTTCWPVVVNLNTVAWKWSLTFPWCEWSILFVHVPGFFYGSNN